MNPSEAAVSACSFLMQYVKKIKKHMPEKHKKDLLDSLGSQMVQNLISHYGSLKYTVEGAFALEIDLDLFHGILKETQIPGLEGEFLELKSLVNILKLKESEVRGYIENHTLLKYIPEEIIERFVNARAGHKKPILSFFTKAKTQ